MLRIVYLRDGKMLLTKKQHGDWREIQDEYEGYVASLGPWPVADVIEFLDAEYSAWLQNGTLPVGQACPMNSHRFDATAFTPTS